MRIRGCKRLVGLNRIIQKNYQTMSPEDYLLNQRDSMMNQKRQKTDLAPLPNSNHAENTYDTVTLIGVPNKMDEGQKDIYTDDLQKLLFEYRPDLIYLQLDPSQYIARQRYMAHKCALKETEDYDIKAIQQIDPNQPESWEETVVNLTVLDMLRENKGYDELDLTSGFATLNHPQYQGLEEHERTHVKDLIIPLRETIKHDIIGPNFSDYYSINKLLFTAMMGKHRVMLGGIPETLYRQILGNSVSLSEMQDFFRLILDKMDGLEEQVSFKEAAHRIIPHILQTPKDLYQTAMLKEAFQCSVNMLAYVEMPQWQPIQRYWEPAPYGINFTEATQIPERIRGETDEMLIEKQALLEVMLQSRAWGQKYISNPFPYLVEDITKVDQQSLKDMKTCFRQNLVKYQGYAQKQQVKQIQNQRDKEKFKYQTFKIPNLNVKKE